MPSGLIALLDDVATIAKLAAASADDVGAAVGKAGSKATALLIDDTAVTPRYVTGLTPDRELPIIGKIALGSLRNKLLMILPIALLLSAFAPWLVTPILMIGGTYLCFEGAEKVWEKLSGEHHDDAALAECEDPGELEQRQVTGAIRTDFILSAEIMVISLSTLEASGFWVRASALALVGIVMTIAVYGAVGLIVKLDDIGLHLARRGGSTRHIGLLLVRGVPKLLGALAAIGTAAMLWVGGQILLHGLEQLQVLEALPHFFHDLAHGGAELVGFWVPVWQWLLFALGSAVIGTIVGAIVVAVLHLIPRRRAPAVEGAR